MKQGGRRELGRGKKEFGEKGMGERREIKDEREGKGKARDDAVPKMKKE